MHPAPINYGGKP